MVGEAVTPVRFGTGSVISFEPPRITIAFDNSTEKTFAPSLSADLSDSNGIKLRRRQSGTETKRRSSARNLKWLDSRTRDGRRKRQTVCV